jgi:hypothetical protein
MLRLYTTPDAFSLSDVWRNTIKSRFRKLLQTSSLWTVRFFFSIDRSIDRTLRCKFQRRSIRNVGEVTGLLPTLKTCISVPPLPTPLVNSLLTLHSRRPFERVFFSFSRRRTRPRTRPSPCAHLTECQNCAVLRGLLLCTIINVSDCTLSCLPLRLPHAVDLPAVLQVGVAPC